MNKRMELKVGLFVLIGLVLTAGMITRFSKGTGFSGSYELKLEARNAGGIIPGASVLMAGVPIGNVQGIILATDGAKVTMLASIYDRFKIATNAIWSIATVGLLGDRYVAVSPGPPGKAESPTFLKEGDAVRVQEAFDIAQVAESAAGLMDRLSGTVDQLSNAVIRLDRTVLSDESLSNLSLSIGNLRGVSERAVLAVHNLNSFIVTNTTPLNHTISNLNLFSFKLKEFTGELHDLLATNRPNISASVKNIESMTRRADSLLAEVEAGEGLAGKLLSNREMAERVSTMVSNLMIFSSNLNSKGLWVVLRKPKPQK